MKTVEGFPSCSPEVSVRDASWQAAGIWNAEINRSTVLENVVDPLNILRSRLFSSYVSPQIMNIVWTTSLLVLVNAGDVDYGIIRAIKRGTNQIHEMQECSWMFLTGAWLEFNWRSFHASIPCNFPVQPPHLLSTWKSHRQFSSWIQTHPWWIKIWGCFLPVTSRLRLACARPVSGGPSDTKSVDKLTTSSDMLR